jgi:hypothetical protein
MRRNLSGVLAGDGGGAAVVHAANAIKLSVGTSFFITTGGWETRKLWKKRENVGDKKVPGVQLVRSLQCL